MATDVWLYWTDPHQLLFRGVVPFLYVEGQRPFWERKLRLWAAACCHRLSPFLSRSLLDEAAGLLTALADGQISGDDFLARLTPFRERVVAEIERDGAPLPIDSEALSTLLATLILDPVEGAEMGVLGTSRVRAFARLGTLNEDSDEMDEAIAEEDHPIVATLRDIVGHPFRPVIFDPSWRTSDVMPLAQGIYEHRAFDRMPILADALQDAGCDSEDILGHCREPGEHVRGCWVVDLVLGKA